MIRQNAEAIKLWIDGFLRDCRVRDLSPFTIEYYHDDFTGARGETLLLCLLDTGAREREFLSLNLVNVDVIGGGVILHKTKNRKPRTVFLGKKSRKALRAYLKRRTDLNRALWVTIQGERLAISSLQGMSQPYCTLGRLNIIDRHVNGFFGGYPRL